MTNDEKSAIFRHSGFDISRRAGIIGYFVIRHSPPVLLSWKLCRSSHFLPSLLLPTNGVPRQ